MEKQFKHKKRYQFEPKSSHNNHGYYTDEIYRPDYLQKDYAKKSIPSLWDHTKETESGLHVGNSNFRLNGSLSTAPKQRCCGSRKAFIWLLVLGSFVIIGGAIGIAVYFTSYYDVQDQTVEDAPSELIFQGNITFNIAWDPALADDTSQAYTQKVLDVSSMFEKVFGASMLQDYYTRNEIVGFSKGSIVVIILVTFRNPESVEQEVTAAPPIEEITYTVVEEEFVKIVNSGLVPEVNQFNIVMSQVSFKDVTGTPSGTTLPPKSTPSATSSTLLMSGETTPTDVETSTQEDLVYKTTDSTTTSKDKHTLQTTIALTDSHVEFSTQTHTATHVTLTSGSTLAEDHVTYFMTTLDQSEHSSTSHGISEVTTQPMDLNNLIDYFVTMTLSNVTWIEAYNNEDSNDYKRLINDIQQDIEKFREHLRSGGTSKSMPISDIVTAEPLSRPVPIQQILYDANINYVQNHNEQVMVMLRTTFVSGNVLMPDDSTQPLDSDWIKIQMLTSLSMNNTDFTVSGCNLRLETAFGRIHSPGYPYHYPKDITCSIYIQSPWNLPITMTFTDFDIEATFTGHCFDSVVIYDGNQTSNQLLGSFCGDDVPRDINAMSGSLIIQLNSDLFVTRKGFDAMFSDSSVNLTTEAQTPPRVTGTCGGLYTGISGLFASPGYPGPYPDSSSCLYLISLPRGYIINITIEEFSTETCCDYVLILDGMTVTSPTLAVLRGDYDTPQIVTSTASSVIVYFFSDISIFSSGFVVSYKGVIEACPIDQLKCQNNSSEIECVSTEFLCDGQNNCANGYDELYCQNYTIESIPTTTATIPSTTTANNILLKDYEIRLVNGKDCLEGRVEVKLDDTWGTISTSTFTTKEAGIICYKLGYSRYNAIPFLDRHFGQASLSTPVWFSYIQCTGMEQNLRDCSLSYGDYATHQIDVGVICDPGNEAHYCSFEEDCFLVPYTETNVYWTTGSGCTSSALTGPCTGSDGSSTSLYIFLEVSLALYRPDTAELRSNVEFDDHPKCLSFYYHMYGETINELQVKILPKENLMWKVVWSKKNDQGNLWHFVRIDLPAIKELRFIGISGELWTGDIALDEVKLFRGPCDLPCQSTKPPPDEMVGVSCTFTDTSICGYQTSAVNGLGTWQIYQESSHTLPDKDAGDTKSGYVYYQNPDGKEGDTARLVSPSFLSKPETSVRFFFYFGGTEGGSLQVFSVDASGNRTSHWAKSGTSETGWLLNCFRLNTFGNMHLEFVAVRTSDDWSMIAVDKVTVSEEKCDYGIVNNVCDFDHPQICGYQVNTTQQYTWKRNSGPTTSEHTGPSGDSVGHGHYMYTEATNGYLEDTTALTFPEFFAAGSQFVHFNCHMHGVDIGSLMVQAKTKGDNFVKTIWSRSGSHGNNWFPACVELGIENQMVELSLVAVRGDGPFGDIAIDDVVVTDTECPYSASCDFSFGSCGYITTIEKDLMDSWQTEETEKYFHVQSSSKDEGVASFLFSSIFQATGTESVTFQYKNTQYTRFEVGWVTFQSGNLTDVSYSDINLLYRTTSAKANWTKRCFSLDGALGEIAVVFIHRSSFGETQFSAVDNIVISASVCKDRLEDGVCGFEPLDLCQYSIKSSEECSKKTSYGWKTHTDHRGTTLFSDGSLGEIGDTTTVSFPNTNVTQTMYMQFQYMIENWENEEDFMYTLGRDSEFLPVLSEKPFVSRWTTFCVEVMPGNDVTVMLRTKKTSDLMNRDVFVDDVQLSTVPCKEQSLSCNFSDSSLCGYVLTNTWEWIEDDTKQPTEYFISDSGMDMETSFIVSPKSTVSDDLQCIAISYRYHGSQYGHMMLHLRTNNSDEVAMEFPATNGWREIKYETKTSFDYLLVSIEPSLWNYRKQEVAAVESIVVSAGSCSILTCPSDEVVCSSGLQCIPESLWCDSVVDCLDSSDEAECDATSSCDFNKPRLCEYKLVGNTEVRKDTSDSYIRLNSGFSLLTSPVSNITTNSCLSFTLRNRVAAPAYSFRLVLDNIVEGQESLFSMENLLTSDLWIEYKTNIPIGQYSIVFELLTSNGYADVDDVGLHEGECETGCGEGFYNCSKDVVCIQDRLVCDHYWTCSDGQDEENCGYSIDCDFEESQACDYSSSSWQHGSSNFSLGDWYIKDNTHQNATGSFMYTGDLYGLYEDNILESPLQRIHNFSCLKFYYLVLRPHEYSSVLLTVDVISQSLTEQKFSLLEYQLETSLQWRKVELSVPEELVTVKFTAGGHRSLVAIDDVMLLHGECEAEDILESTTIQPLSESTTFDSQFTTVAMDTSSQAWQTTLVKERTTGVSTVAIDTNPVDNYNCYQHPSMSMLQDVCTIRHGLNDSNLPNIFGSQSYYEATSLAEFLLGNVPSSPKPSCYDLQSYMVCSMVFPYCDNGTVHQICRQSCLDSFAILVRSCDLGNTLVEDLIYYCDFIDDDNGCLAIPDFNIDNTEAITSTMVPTTEAPEVGLSHIDYLPVNQTSGIVEIVYRGQFGYLQCSEDVYCPQAACLAIGFKKALQASSISLVDNRIFSVECLSHDINVCSFDLGTSSTATLVYCDQNSAIESMFEAINCEFGNSFQGSCSYINNGWDVLDQGITISHESANLITAQITMATSSSIQIWLSITSPPTHIIIQLQKMDGSFVQLGRADVGDSYVCLSVTSYLEGKLVFSADGDFKDAIIYKVVYGLQSVCNDPFPIGLCEFDSSCLEQTDFCPIETDPMTFKWRHVMQYLGSSISNQYMSADSSFGETGDQSRFVLPVNISANQNLRLKFRKIGSSNNLKISLNADDTSSMIFTSNDMSTKGSWESVCVPLTPGEIINGNLEFVATRGSEYTDEISVDDIELTDNDCSSIGSCDFDSPMNCHYTIQSESTYVWTWGSHDRIVDQSKVDMTKNLESYLFTVPCQSSDEIEGDITQLTSPQFNLTTTKQMKVSFYYYMHGVNTGTLDVRLDGGNNLETIFTVTGSQSNQWVYICVNLPLEDVGVSLMFSAVRGDGCDSIIAVDNVAISEGTCSVLLNELTCGFEGTDSCRYTTNSTEGSNFQWSRQKSKTPSDRTGPHGDADGSFEGHFMYVESSYGQEGDKTWLSFPSFLSNLTSSLHFSYHMMGEDIGSLQILADDTSTVTQIWSKTGNQGRLWIKSCVELSPLTEQKIHFVATKSTGFYGDIAVDNVYVLDEPCQDSSITCDFEDTGFLCGFINGTSPTADGVWNPVSYSSGNNPAVVMSSKTGNFIYSASFTEESTLVSPRVNISTKSCISFNYYTYFHSYGGGLMISVLLIDDTDYFTHVKERNTTEIWSTQENSGGRWTTAQFVIGSGDRSIVMVIQNIGGLVGIDDVKITDGACATLECPGELSCGDFCISLDSVCDRVYDCPDHVDEINCGGSISCDFEDPHLCGYMDLSDHGVMEGKHVIYQDRIYDHTTGSKAGTFYGMVSYVGHHFSFESPTEMITDPSCLSLYYTGEVQKFAVETHYTDKSIIRNLVFDDSLLTNMSNVWKPMQIPLHAGEVKILFNLTDHGDRVKYLGIDDVNIILGDCPPLDCPDDHLPCHKDGICVGVRNECDKIKDCPSGEDEAMCSFNLTCDFEELDICGYSTGNIFTRRDAFVHHQPSIDHTFKGTGNVTGHYAYFVSSTGESDSFLSPRAIRTSGGCVHFYYAMSGGPSAELKVYVIHGGMKSFVFYANGINIKIDEWVEGHFELPAGEMLIEFAAFGDRYFFGPSVVAIDDVEFREGESCPKTDCDGDYFKCQKSGVCIPEFLLQNGYSDCLDGSDEVTDFDDSDNTDDISTPSNLLSLCTFEGTEDQPSCIFSNDQTGKDNADWQIATGQTPSSNTGPSSAIEGSSFLYIESSDMETNESARFVSSVLHPDKTMCLGFWNYMYGDSIGSLKVMTSVAGSTSGPVLFSKSSDQGRKWHLQTLHVPALNNTQIIFQASDGDGFRGDIAIDKVMLFSGSCDESFMSSSVIETNPLIRLVGGKTEAGGRLEVQLNRGSKYLTVCEDLWDEEDSKVACHQLGFSQYRLYRLSEYGFGRPERDSLGYEFMCTGNETSLQECHGEVINGCDSTRMALECTNTECFPGEWNCYGVEGTCISEADVCNGNIDCPNLADERNCHNCSSDEFVCSNHECIPKEQRCDGLPQCQDKSDEHQCLEKLGNGHVIVYIDGFWQPLCYHDNPALSHYLCSLTGYGGYASHSIGDNVTEGYLPIAGDNPNGVIEHYSLIPQQNCAALVLQCGSFECGVPSITQPEISPLVLFGNDAVNGEWPWQALLFMDGSPGCGAVLIDTYYAVTAAHCVVSWTQFEIHVGEVKKSEMLGPNDHGQRIPVAEVFAHPDYISYFGSYLSDIAVLRLGRPAVYNQYVRPVCIATELKETHENCHITGWGYIEDIDEEGFTGPNNLQEEHVDINTDVDRCNNSVINKLELVLPASGICIDNQSPYAPACHGDSGGPAVCQNSQGRWELLGVTSFGWARCKGLDIPDIYQSIPYHIDWIVKNTGIQINHGQAPTRPPSVN